MNKNMRIDSITLYIVEDDNPDLGDLDRTAEDYDSGDASIWDDIPEGDKAKLIEKFGSIYAVSEIFARIDQARLKEYIAGELATLGIYAEAKVSHPIVNEEGQRRLDKFNSDGLWGLASDMGADDLWAEMKEQIWNLKHHLERFGVVDEPFFKDVLDATASFDFHPLHTDSSHISTFLLHSQVFHNRPLAGESSDSDGRAAV